jgi:hypothetical protein
MSLTSAGGSGPPGRPLASTFASRPLSSDSPASTSARFSARGPATSSLSVRLWLPAFLTASVVADSPAPRLSRRPAWRLWLPVARRVGARVDAQRRLLLPLALVLSADGQDYPKPARARAGRPGLGQVGRRLLGRDGRALVGRGGRHGLEAHQPWRARHRAPLRQLVPDSHWCVRSLSHVL